MPCTYTPLRFPGGKSRLSGFLRDVIKANGLGNPLYVEPYCGGAGAALNLLFNEVVSDVHLNDLDRGIYSFWRFSTRDPEALCDRIANVSLSVTEWEKQKDILRSATPRATLDIGFAALYLNRVNRSGILRGGLIGGRNQDGPWKMGARFNRESLIAKVRQIGRNAHRIHVTRMNAATFLRHVARKLSGSVFLYLDPPYVKKGGSLYQNHYDAADHASIAQFLRTQMPHPWVVSYDDCALVKKLYQGLPQLSHRLSYSAHLARRRGREIVILGPGVKLPGESRPNSARPAPVRLAFVPPRRPAA